MTMPLEEFKEQKARFIEAVVKIIVAEDLHENLQLDPEFIAGELWNFIWTIKRIRRQFWSAIDMPFIVNPKMKDVNIMIAMLEWIKEHRFDYPVCASEIEMIINGLKGGNNERV
jgi:hypothetical protein